MTAVTGEVGEAANIIKKIRRGDMTLDEARLSLANELADAATYLDILAYRAGINLGKAIESKWNETSRRVDVVGAFTTMTSTRSRARRRAPDASYQNQDRGRNRP